MSLAGKVILVTGAGRGLGRTMALVGDVTREPEVEACMRQALGRFGQIDVLVNNAGVAGPLAFLWETTWEDWERVLAVNLKGAGSIVNITSGLGRRGMVRVGPYCVSKFAPEGFTQVLAGDESREVTGSSIDALAWNRARGLWEEAGG